MARSGLKVPVLSFGAGTFGGSGPLFGAWGTTDADEARRLVDICLEAGVNLFDTADVYSAGASEEVLGQAIRGRRDSVLISTKTALPMGDGPARLPARSRSRLIRATDDALRRLGTDYIDLLQLHAFDASTPVEEVLSTLDGLVVAGKGPLCRRLELLRLGADEVAGGRRAPRLSALRRPPGLLFAGRPRLRMGADAARRRPGRRRAGLEPARLGPADRQDPPRPAACREGSRLHQTADFGPPVDDEKLFDIVDVLDEIAEETGKTVPQIAINWLLSRPTVSSVIIGARNEEQLRQNLGAVGWNLTQGADRHGSTRPARDGALSLLSLSPAGGVCAAQSAACLRCPRRP